MNKIKRFYNQNRKKIWRIIIIIAFLFAILQLANFMVKSKNEKDVQSLLAQQNYIQNNKTNSTTSTIINNNSEQASEQTTNTKKSTINKFIAYCNQKNLEEAYNMLTEDCKQEMFNNIETFASIYYNSTFENTEKEATIENWEDNTYMVKFTKNALATGKIASTKEEQKVDYITAVKEDEGYKLNINSYIGYKKIEKAQEQDGIKVEVVGKHVYLDYETYVIKATNNSDNKCVLDSLYTSGSIYIQDSKGSKYSAYNGELTSEMVTVEKGHTKQLEIRFSSTYVSDRKIEQLVFADIVKNKQRTSFKIYL